MSPDQFFSAAFLANPDMIAVSLLEDGTYLQINDAFLAIIGYEREEIVGRTSTEIGLWADPADRERLRARVSEEGVVYGFVVLLRMKGGELRRFDASAARMLIDGRECMTSVCRDITERTAMVAGLEKSHFLLERAEEMANIGSWEFDFAAHTVSASQGAYRIYGLKPGEFSIEAVEAIPLPEYRRQLDEARDGLIKDGRPYDIEFKIARRSDGAVRDIHSMARWDAANARLFGIIRDVTEERQIEEELRRALADKETLLKELYHRTKNNMQVIASLLALEADRSSDSRLHDVFAQVQRRIASMSLVHEMLYRSKDLSRIDIGEFVSSLVGLLRASLGDGEGRVSFVCEIESIAVFIEAALPCAIILNELVTNALVHAFPPGRSGSIVVRGSRDARGLLRLEVRDDGVGAPEGTRFDDPENLGLWLVSNIGRNQLNGSVEFDASGPGFGCVLAFDDGAFEPRARAP